MSNKRTPEDCKDADTSFSARWKRTVGATHKPILKALHTVSGISARNPVRTCCGVALVSLALVVIGWFTNFTVDVDESALWTPFHSKPAQHRQWIRQESLFVPDKRELVLVFHENSENILGQGQVRRVFSVIDSVRNLPRYSLVCGGDECKIQGVVNFWNNSAAVFESQVSSDEEAIQSMSASYFSDGSPVARDLVFGHPVQDESTGDLLSAQSYSLVIRLPITNETEEFEKDALDVIFNLNDAWDEQAAADDASSAEDHTNLQVEALAERSFHDEFSRGMLKDLRLVPMVFIVMSIFTCVVFSCCADSEHSRSLLGFGAVFCVLLSLMGGYGLMFVCGVPFTPMSQVLPFIIFGVGLDDAFVVFGSYNRTNGDGRKDPVERIAETIDDVGISITLTTLTSTVAFALGCISTVPAIRCLCLYAFPTIIMVFFYQMTFFVACIVLDEKRILAQRSDCCCFSLGHDDAQGQDGGEDESVSYQLKNSSVTDRFMHWYGEQLLHPSVKVVIIILFAALLAGFSYSASNLHQEFDVTDVVPNDSYVRSFIDSVELYTSQAPIRPYAYFRFVDQSDPVVQDQMQQYIDELVKIDAVENGPHFFWLRDFKMYVRFNTGLENQSFNSQIRAFLSEPIFYELYREDLALDSLGYITASRVPLRMDNVNVEDLKEGVAALMDQRAVSAAQPINAGRSDWAFFTYSGEYLHWEFFSVVVGELVLTTIIGVAAVTGVVLFFVPFWSAALFILPIISILYVNLLGFIQWMGASVNPVSYVALVMSIGLLVDFVLHVLVHYLEGTGTREERTISMLSSMGSSILLGGVSTALGLLPLFLSSSQIFQTMFVSFLGLVVLGISHGLILLPVVLLMIGPENSLRDNITVAGSTSIPDSLSDNTTVMGSPDKEDPPETSSESSEDVDL